jgi:hypothetical protein
VAREGRAVANQRRLSRVLWLLLVVFGATGLAYFVVPAASLRVVGIASDPTERFLLRTLAAALLAFVLGNIHPKVWMLLRNQCFPFRALIDSGYRVSQHSVKSAIHGE